MIPKIEITDNCGNIYAFLKHSNFKQIFDENTHFYMKIDRIASPEIFEIVYIDKYNYGKVKILIHVKNKEIS